MDHVMLIVDVIVIVVMIFSLIKILNASKQLTVEEKTELRGGRPALSKSKRLMRVYIGIFLGVVLIILAKHLKISEDITNLVFPLIGIAASLFSIITQFLRLNRLKQINFSPLYIKTMRLYWSLLWSAFIALMLTGILVN